MQKYSRPARGTPPVNTAAASSAVGGLRAAGRTGHSTRDMAAVASGMAVPVCRGHSMSPTALRR
ncbi:hypothetical protein PCANC_12671 [Puccinia coronata f. sp. avenae]|uniref:Uncharacterized protein n=1 Tax=Puccinia coronata f. sp. avenae TaxID=200324 RepID=A0A2N5SY75_9BASI|nr:hypothetical protein PCANC_12671 [Puccinia coronata f. sp. avenae]